MFFPCRAPNGSWYIEFEHADDRDRALFAKRFDMFQETQVVLRSAVGLRFSNPTLLRPTLE